MLFLNRLNFKLLLKVIFCLIFTSSKSQKNYFGDEPVVWGDNKPYVIPATCENYLKSDLVILDDKTSFYFYSLDNEKIIRRLIVKINNKNGLSVFQNYKLPESFDNAFDANLNKQGRAAKIKTPFISEYQVNKFAARKFSQNKWSDVQLKNTFETIRRIRWSGEYMNDELSCFQLLNLSVGDVVEIYYEAGFSSSYGTNIFYFNSIYPKLNCEYNFIYKMNKRFAGYEFVKPENIKSDVIKKTYVEQKENLIRTDKIILTDLPGINYSANSFEAIQLPHVFADFKFYRIINNSYPEDGERRYELEYVRPRNFEWMEISDTSNNYTKVYDKQSASIRKFVNTLPTVTSDSSSKFFFKALCDTFNKFRYISTNSLFYNESNLYDVYSGDHLLKRRLPEQSLGKIYRDILNEKNIFYYVVNVQDRRYGEHSMSQRSHYAYENSLIAIPHNSTYIYFMPRFNGLKYHLNELPFYYEGSTAALAPENFQKSTKNKKGTYKFIKTHMGTFNENTRTENATVRISVDSAKAGLTIKESLSGQFSTVLRHLYLNEYVDSTISPHYFKKCTQKPNASGEKIKLSSSVSDFPFRYTFNCSEKIVLGSKQTLDMRNWFSFIVSKQSLPELPTHDYYFDFDFTDAYNFSLDFDVPMDITNSAGFLNKISNSNFGLESEIVKNSESNYLVKVKFIVKDRKLPLEKVELLAELLDALESINNYSLTLVKK